MPSVRVVAPGKHNGLPFAIPHATLWDGVTLLENGTGSNTYGEVDPVTYTLPVFTPDELKVGSGTPYPIGMTLDMAKRCFSRVRSWNLVAEIVPVFADPYSLSETLSAGFDAANERELQVKHGFAGGTQVAFYLFAGFGYETPATSIAFPRNDILSGLETNFHAVDLEFNPSDLMLRIGDTYYPQLGVTGFGVATGVIKSGDPEAEISGVTIAFDPDTMTFIAEGSPPSVTDIASFTATVTPALYWSYAGRYDTATGLPV